MALGETLRKAREAMGLTEAEVADRTHIMSSMVREIEAEDYHRFSAPIYGKGFIKLYAKFVGLDPAPLVAEFLATVGDSDSTKQNAFVALETIDTEHGGGITVVKPEGQPQHAVRPSSTPAPAAPVPHHVVAKASAVTMPSMDFPHPLPGPSKPVQKPAPVPAQPAAAHPAPVQSAAPTSPPQPADSQKPRSTADDIRPGDSFKLEAEPAVSVAPPQPMVQPAETFKFPSPKPPLAQQRPVSSKTKFYVEDEDDVEIMEKAPPRRRPENRRRKASHPVPGFIKRLQSGASACIASIRDRVSASRAADDEEDSHIKRRYLLSGISVFAVLAVILIIAGQGPSSEPDIEREAPPSQQVADEAGEAPLAGPVEILRVLPPPKVFAK